jgi:hypothetical protein
MLRPNQTLVALVLASAACAELEPTAPSSAPPPAPAPPSAEPLAVIASPVLDDGEVCKKASAKPPPREYKGLLRGVKCEDQMYLTMANVATELGVRCEYCHVQIGDNKFDFPAMTPKKEVANWMYQHLMQSVRRKDGSRFSCSSCHRDDAGKPVAKVLGNPRDEVRANEWMTLVMTTKFRAANGDPLKCRSCHVGMYSKPEWQPKVILQSGQIPAHRTP